MKLITPFDRAYYYVRDDGSPCCGKIHGTRKAADACADAPPPPPRKRRTPLRREREVEEDPRAVDRIDDGLRFLRSGGDEW